MKSIPKFIRRFVGIMILSITLLVILNVAFFAVTFVKHAQTVSAWDTAAEAAAALRRTGNRYALPGHMEDTLKAQNVWAVLIDDEAHQVVWHTDNLPDRIPTRYTLSDISELARGYVEGYPAFTGKAEGGLLVLGYPKDSYWKLTRANWDYDFIVNLPKNALIALSINAALIFLIYAAANAKLLCSIKPITNGIQDLSIGAPVHLDEKGVLSEIAEHINRTSDILQQQSEQLRKKETARANWIAGISHDVRTPLSMVMGYAGQLANAENLSEAERQKAIVIVRQSRRMQGLINDLNLASELEYDMQPLAMKRENLIAVVRQVVADFMNTSIDDRFPIQWEATGDLSSCCIDADKDLLKRAIANLIQNCINHNEGGCAIYVSVIDYPSQCAVCVEDNGTGASDEQIDRLNNAPHYMACDTDTAEQRHGLGLLIVRQITAAHNGKVVIGHSGYGGFKVVVSIPKYTNGSGN